jgi:hypothetical protein
MTKVQLLEKEALTLSEKDRAILATHLLETLPEILMEADEGFDEALRRDLEIDSGAAKCITLAELKKSIRPS